MAVRENKLDKSLRCFNLYASFFIAFIMLIELVLFYLYFLSFYNQYRVFLFNIIILILFIEILLGTTIVAIAYTYRSNRANSWILIFLRFGLKIVLPLFIAASEVLNGNQDCIRRIYIRINNTLIPVDRRPVRPDRVLVLLPHCVQYKDCGNKVTDDIGRCRQCGRCRIGEVSQLTRAAGARAVVVGGGTAARNIVKDMHPDLILAVACERELLSGIADIGAIPVIGVINERPNGYCCNTSLDVGQFAEKLRSVMSNR